ncbi:MAG: DUF3298 domain-containing protein [Lachnospiraceae bacterium]|jgi:hypothetical protein|nr:DUF3298 domain-containing protein [Lachnospiraceae bacterium]
MKKRLLAGLLFLTLLPVTGCSKAKPADVAEKPATVVEEPTAEEQEAEDKTQIPQILLTEQQLHVSYAQHEDTAATGLWVTASLDGDSAALYPELEQSLSAYASEIAAGEMGSFLDLREDTLAYEESGEDITYFHGSTENRVSVYRNDGAVLSLLENRYYYSPGAAHGFYDVSGACFDVATGARLELSDVWKGSTEELISILAERLQTAYPDAEFFSEDLEGDIATIVNSYEFAGWYVGEDSLDFYFGPYSLAAYAAGSFEVQLPYTDYSEKLNEAYFQPTEGYHMVASNLYATCSDFDVDGDGTQDSVQTLPRYEDGAQDVSMTDGATITAGDKTLEVDLNAEEIHPYYIYDGDGHLYIYLVTGGKTTNNVIAVCEYNGKNLRYVDTFQGTLAEMGIGKTTENLKDLPEDVGITTKCCYAFTNPGSFYLQQRINPLSTADGRMEYTIGNDGMPKAVSQQYAVVVPFTLTSLVDLEAELVEDGSTMTLPAGSTIEITASDAATYVEGTIEDGRTVRIACDLSWPQTVAEQNAEDVFEGIYYDE